MKDNNKGKEILKLLHHQDYDGKRLNISLKDNYNNIIDTKLDIGVNKFWNWNKKRCVSIYQC